jgi:hypothetical protein
MRLNEYMALDIYLGHMSPSEVALMSGDDMLTMEARQQSELTKLKAHEAKQLDWAQKMRPQILESIGLDQGLGDPCKKCRGKNTTYTQKQTRSADEPMTACVFPAGLARGRCSLPCVLPRRTQHPLHTRPFAAPCIHAGSSCATTATTGGAGMAERPGTEKRGKYSLIL